MQTDPVASADLTRETSSPDILNSDASLRNPNDTDAFDEKPQRGFRFWAIIIALCTVSLLSAAENTVVVTALPTIVEKLNVGQDYVWISNVFFLTR